MQPIRVLLDEHRTIRSALDLLEAAAHRVADGDAVALDAATDLLELFWHFGDRVHQGKEEDLLFPALIAAGQLPDGGPCEVMRAQHAQDRAVLQLAWDSARRGLAGTRDRKAFCAACHRFVALSRAHLEEEEQVLFPLAERNLGEAEHARLAASFRARTEREAEATHRCHEVLLHVEAALGRQSGTTARGAVG